MTGDSATTTDESAATAARSLEPGDAPAAGRASIGSRAATAWGRIEQALVYAGDWLNPILVKETRQALKSFQFTITFVLVLVACWIVTIGGVAVIGPRIFYSADGGQLLQWYYAVLAFPLTVVVPYAAFRSLAAEREDNTYDLLAITALKPRQIISGKLGSSVVQMAVYFSAIAPCIAFTYLLRGVDVPTIAVLLVYTFFGSLGLSMIGILTATLSQQRIAQVFVSVALVAFLLLMFWNSVFGMASSIIRYSYSYWGGEAFWISSAAMTTAYVTFFSLAYFAAAGMITFTSENRSTPLRICMLVQQAAFVGWMLYAWIYASFELAVLFVLGAFSTIYWYAMGTLLTAERSGMSHRVRRRLPTSFLGRVFFSWLNPGPASGYMFVIANASSIGVLCLLAVAASQSTGPPPVGWIDEVELVYTLAVGWSYLVAYLGLGMLLINALRRVAVVTMLASVLIHFLLLLAGSGIPTAIQLMSVELRYAEYTLLQISNPIWSLKHLAEGPPPEAKVLILVVPAAALCVFLLNLRGVIRELRQVRVAPPPRVMEDEAELHPAPAPQPASPWDE